MIPNIHFSIPVKNVLSQPHIWLIWPKGMSYLQWKKIFLWMPKRCKHKKISKKLYIRNRDKRRKTLRQKSLLKMFRNAQKCKCRKTKLALNVEALNEDPFQLINSPCKKNTSKKDTRLELITLLKMFLERKKIPKNFDKHIPECRSPEQIMHSSTSIMLAALSIFLFRMQSGNKYQEKSHDPDGKYSRENIAKFINSTKKRAPVIRTIEKFLKRVSLDKINQLMIDFIKDLRKSKFFSDHPEIKFKDHFLLAVDCVHSHTYDKPHHIDEDGKNDCPYCLERVYNKGTSGPKVRWMHHTLVYTFVFLQHLKIPCYTYPIHAKQLRRFATTSDGEFKQECELVALKETLPLIRNFFPRMKICLLLDGLYANRPTIQLANELGFKYAIVRKDKSLTSLAKDCDGLAEMPDIKKNCTKTTTVKEEGWTITRTYTWFNEMDLGGSKDKRCTTHVLRFSECREKFNTRTKKNELKNYRGEWLFSEKLTSRNCERAAYKARLRWEEEDLFNSVKNRTFNYKHDYSRDPRSFIIWQALSFYAFAIFELFQFSQAVSQRSQSSRIALVEKLSAQLYERPTKEIFNPENLTKRIQFRYDFSAQITKQKKRLETKAPKLRLTG